MRTARAVVVCLAICAFPVEAQRPDLEHPDPRVRSSLDSALLAWRARDFVRARAHYDAALSVDPSSVYGLMGRGRALAELRDTAAAIADLRRAAALGLSAAASWADRFEREQAPALAPAPAVEESLTPPERPCNQCIPATAATAGLVADARWFVTAPFAKYVGLALLVVALLMGVWVRLAPHGEIPEYAIHRGEKVRWVGSPSEGFRLYGADLIRIPVSIAFTMVLISNFRSEGAFDLASYDLSPVSILFVAVASPLIAMAVYGLFGRFFDDARRRKRTIYAITNQRAITVVGKQMSWRMVRSLSSISLKQHLDSSASIYADAPELELDLRYAEDENFRPTKRTRLDHFLANARGPEWQFGRGKTSNLLFERVQHGQLALEEIERVKAEPPPQLVG